MNQFDEHISGGGEVAKRLIVTPRHKGTLISNAICLHPP